MYGTYGTVQVLVPYKINPLLLKYAIFKMCVTPQKSGRDVGFSIPKQAGRDTFLVSAHAIFFCRQRISESHEKDGYLPYKWKQCSYSSGRSIRISRRSLTTTSTIEDVVAEETLTTSATNDLQRITLSVLMLSYLLQLLPINSKREGRTVILVSW